MSNQASADAIAERIVQAARQDFQRRESEIRDLLVSSVESFQKVNILERELEEHRDVLTRSIAQLSELGVPRKQVASAVGVSEVTLSKRLTQKKRRYTKRKTIRSNQTAASSMPDTDTQET